MARAFTPPRFRTSIGSVRLAQEAEGARSRHHIQKMQKRLQEIIDHLRDDIDAHGGVVEERTYGGVDDLTLIGAFAPGLRIRPDNARRHSIRLARHEQTGQFGQQSLGTMTRHARANATLATFCAYSSGITTAKESAELGWRGSAEARRIENRAQFGARSLQQNIT